MSRLPVQHRPRSLFPEFGELLDGFPSWATCVRSSTVTSFGSRTN